MKKRINKRLLNYYLNYGERQKILDEMVDYCGSNSILSFADLVDCACSNHCDNWFKVLCSNGGTRYMVKYFRRKNNFTGRF